MALKSFCQKQLETRLAELVGSADQYRPVIPETYVMRMDLESSFHQWQASSQKCFGLVGDSGLGKTNFMCIKAKEIVESQYVLFYPAYSLRSGFFEAIRWDLEWEFLQDRSLPNLINRLADIAQQGDSELIIFIDGLDEFPGDITSLESELSEFVRHTNTLPIRLVVSCKSFDWDRFVLVAGRYYNTLGVAIFPQAPTVTTPNGEKPKAEDIGYHLRSFTAAELDTVYDKYRIVFTLPDNELTAPVQEQLRFPLLLRLFAETYRGSSGQLPMDVSSPELWQSFVKQKLLQVSQPDMARNLLGSIALRLVEEGRREISLDDFSEGIVSPAWQQLINDILRVGLLTARSTASGTKRASFASEKLRSYVYVVHGKLWIDKAPHEVASEIAELMVNQQQLSLEAVRFFVEEIDRGETIVLTYLVDAHLEAFLSLTGGESRHAQYQVSVEHLDSGKRSSAYWNRLEQYARAYSRIRLRHFQRLASRLVPHTDEKVGVWSSESGDLIQLRRRNDLYPEPVLLLNPEHASLVFRGAAPQQMLNEIGDPAGAIHLGGLHALIKELPQRYAWNQITDDVLDLVKHGMLDESHTSLILEERIRDMMFFHPNIWIGGIPDRERWFQYMGFQHQDEAYSTSVQELHRIALEQTLATGERLALIEDENTPHRRFWALQLKDIYLLAYWLGALSDHKDILESELMSHDQIFAPIHDEPQVLSVFEPFANGILTAYKSMVDANFPEFANYFCLYNHLMEEAPIVFEITRNPHGGLHSDFFEVRYILLPKEFQAMSGTVFWVRGSESIAHEELILELSGGGVTHVRGGRFGHAVTDLVIGDRRLTGVPITIYQTKFPDRLLITSQIYELLGSELEVILNSRSHWHGVDSLVGRSEELAYLLSRGVIRR
jgi:hypothetical protein